jgi:hypothetical protein
MKPYWWLKGVAIGVLVFIVLNFYLIIELALTAGLKLLGQGADKLFVILGVPLIIFIIIAVTQAELILGTIASVFHIDPATLYSTSDLNIKITLVGDLILFLIYLLIGIFIAYKKWGKDDSSSSL